jgi:hypothetical protein
LIIILLLTACGDNSSGPVVIQYQRIYSTAEPSSYCPISITNQYNYHYKIVDFINYDSFDGKILDTLKYNGSMEWFVWDKHTESITSSYLSATYVLENIHSKRYPVFFSNYKGKPKFSYVFEGNSILEYDIESYPNIGDLEVDSYTFKNVKRISDTLQATNILQYRDYYFAKGVGLVKYNIRQSIFNPNTQKTETLTIDCTLFEFKIK